MVLQDIFDQLSYGELSQVFIGEGDEADVGIKETDRPKVLAHIKLGLLALHKRFLLREGSLTIGLVPDKITYVISPTYAMSNAASVEPVKYILDDESPFGNDLLKIERIYSEDGTELPLNVIDDPDSIRTTSYNVLVIPTTVEGETLRVVYRAQHPEIDPILAQAVPFQTEIDLPPSHLEPLVLFVASRMLNPVGMVTEFHEGNNYAAKYEQACQQLEAQNYAVDTDSVNTRLERNGWV